MKTKISKKLGRRSKIGLAILITTMFIGVASAGLLTYFGKVETTMNVTQSVQIDGQNWDQPITHTLEDAQAGCCYCFEHEITNNGCEAIALEWTHWGIPDMIGIDVTMVQKCYLEHLDINVLDGQAEYDDFEVYVDGILVYTYYAQGGAETWILHTIDLTPYNIICFGTHTITVDCIAGTPWKYWQTYGQLGVDTIALYCGCTCDPVLCDSVDIGDPTSEAGHNLQDWGPIEPATNGGYWGGINDCRATWTSADSYTWASVDLTCDFCECNCEKEPVEEPFTLEPGETIEFCICYKLDMLLAPGTYTIHSKLMPALP